MWSTCEGEVEHWPDIMIGLEVDANEAVGLDVHTRLFEKLTPGGLVRGLAGL